MFKRSGVVTPMNVLKKVRADVDTKQVKKLEEEEELKKAKNKNVTR